MKKNMYLFALLLAVALAACTAENDEPEQPTTRQDEMPADSTSTNPSGDQTTENVPDSILHFTQAGLFGEWELYDWPGWDYVLYNSELLTITDSLTFHRHTSSDNRTSDYSGRYAPADEWLRYDETLRCYRGKVWSIALIKDLDRYDSTLYECMIWPDRPDTMRLSLDIEAIFARTRSQHSEDKFYRRVTKDD